MKSQRLTTTVQQAFELALQHHKAGRLSEAEAIYRQILARYPDHADALHLLGVIAQQMDRDDIAVDLIRRAIAINPALSEAHVNLGNSLRKKGQIDQAVASFRAAIELKGDFPEAHSNLGNVLMDKGQLDEAIASYRMAIKLKPNYHEAHSNLGTALKDKGRYDEAIASYRTAIELKGDFPDGHRNLGLTLLLQGDFAQGWPEIEWRWKCKGFPWRRRVLTKPLWDGSELNHRTILLQSEQGLGDAIQFIRYVPLVAQRGGSIIVECEPELKRLLQSNAGGWKVLASNEPLPAFDVHCPLLSLPLMFGTTLQSIPARVPYLQADSAMAAKWRERLACDSPLLKVGLVWAGSKHNPNDHNRSIALSAFAPFAKSPGIRFFSLQKGEEARQAKNPPAGMELTDWTEELNDFADTAALIANLDLVISVDTAAAHLAAALGKPVWVLLPYVPDWRWMLERQDNPWYPTMRLFRQTQMGDWPEVLQRASDALAEWCEKWEPANPEAHYNLGNALYDKGQLDEAAVSYCVAIELKPNYPEAYYNLGNTLKNKGQWDKAIAAFGQAISLKPNYPKAYYNLANVLKDKGQMDEAIRAYRQAIVFDPNYAQAHLNLGNALKEKGQIDDAIAAYRQAIASSPDYPDAHHNLALMLLLQGDFAQGWKEFEWRWKCKKFSSPRRNFVQSQWDGSELNHRILLLHAEQGFGDALQFCRYFPLAAQRGGKIIVECQPELKRLLQSNARGWQVIAKGEALPPFHLHCPLLSLPLAFKTTLQSIPACVSYLQADADMAAQWRDRLARKSPSLKVGLSWAGSRGHKNDRNRSIALSALIPLARSPGIHFYSLQKGEDGRQAKNPPAALELTDWTDELSDFADTAALIANLDLVICVDTVVAHLAGAMGKPVWVLLPFMPDWRWLLERGDSPWYPTMRLFRQTRIGDWGDVMHQMSEALAQQVPPSA